MGVRGAYAALLNVEKIAKEPENTRAALKTPVGPGSKVLGCARVSTKQSVLKTVQKNTARHRAFGYRAHTLLTGQELRIEYYVYTPHPSTRKL
jgi:hypothetical protein